MVLLNRGRLQLRQLCGAKQNCGINPNRPLNACGESSTMAMGLDECRSLSASVGKTTKYLIPERPQNSTSMASSWHHPMIWYCRNGPASSGADVCPRFRCGWKVVRCGSVKNASSIPSHFRSWLALVVPESTLWFVQATHGAIEHTLDCSRCHRRPFLSPKRFLAEPFESISTLGRSVMFHTSIQCL